MKSKSSQGPKVRREGYKKFT